MKKLLLFVLLSFISFQSAFALDFPSAKEPDPLWLRSCPVNFFGSNSYKCELLGLKGSPTKIAYPGIESPDVAFELEKSKLTESTRRMPGGFSTVGFIYDAAGKLTSTIYNGSANADFKYDGDRIVKIISYVNANTCDYSSKNNKDLDVNCESKYKTINYHVSLDSAGRLLNIDETGARQMNISGAISCDWTEKLTSKCTDGYYNHIFQYDDNLRPIHYTRSTIKVTKDFLELSFSYADDAQGNWISQTIHYIAMDTRTKMPGDVVRTRSIDY